MTNSLKNSIFYKILKKLNLMLVVFGIVLIVLTSVLMYNSIYTVQHIQANNWINTFPSNIVIHLIDSDHFSIENKINLLKSTELFSSFNLYDMDKQKIAGFGEAADSYQIPLRPIFDEGKQVWGYYQFTEDTSSLMTSVFAFCAIGSVLFLLLLVVQYRYTSKFLKSEYSQFNKFISDVFELRKQISFVNDLNDLTMVKQFLPRSDVGTESREIYNNFESLIREIVELQARISEYVKNEESLKAKEMLANLATQVAHDIRSPVMALKSIASKLDAADPRIQTTLNMCIDRINSIADDLLAKNRTKVNSKYCLNSIIAQLLDEKRMEYSDVRVKFKLIASDEYYFNKIDAVKVSRILSNLINNCVEAMDFKNDNSIIVSLDKKDNFIVISVKDTGKGIPMDIIDKLGSRGFSYGKKSGSGIGLFYAKSVVEEVGGRLDIKSTPNEGALVSLSIPNV